MRIWARARWCCSSYQTVLDSHGNGKVPMETSISGIGNHEDVFQLTLVNGPSTVISYFKLPQAHVPVIGAITQLFNCFGRELAVYYVSCLQV